jgi:hypothetical protein
MAPSLIEVSRFVAPQLQTKYLSVAETQLRTLSTPEYLAEPGTNGFLSCKVPEVLFIRSKSGLFKIDP